MMNIYENAELISTLQKEIPVLMAEIRALYKELDRKFQLNGAKVPITFGLEKDLLGSYTREGEGEKEHFQAVPLAARNTWQRMEVIFYQRMGIEK